MAFQLLLIVFVLLPNVFIFYFVLSHICLRIWFFFLRFNHGLSGSKYFFALEWIKHNIHNFDRSGTPYVSATDINFPSTNNQYIFLLLVFTELEHFASQTVVLTTTGLLVVERSAHGPASPLSYTIAIWILQYSIHFITLHTAENAKNAILPAKMKRAKHHLWLA